MKTKKIKNKAAAIFFAAISFTIILASDGCDIDSEPKPRIFYFK